MERQTWTQCKEELSQNPNDLVIKLVVLRERVSSPLLVMCKHGRAEHVVEKLQRRLKFWIRG